MTFRAAQPPCLVHFPAQWLAAALSLVCLFLMACGSGEKPAPPPPAPRFASIAGQVAVPTGVDAFGVMIFAEGTGYVSFTDAQGNWMLKDVPVGSFVLRATRADLQPAEVGRVTVGTRDLDAPQPYLTMATTPLRLRDEAAARAAAARPAFGSMRGRVMAPAAASAADVTVSVQNTEYRTLTDGSGGFVFPSLPPGAYVAVFAREGYRAPTVPFEVSAGKETRLADVMLAPDLGQAPATRTILGRLTLTGIDGNPIARVRGVTVALEGTSAVSVPAADGTFRFDNLEPRSYVVTAAAEGFLLEATQAVNLELVEVGEVSLSLLQIPPDVSATGGTIVGRVLLDGADGGSAAGIAVGLAGTDVVVTTARDGAFRMTNVPPGTYELIATFEGYEPGSIPGVEITEAGEYEADDLVLLPSVDPPTVVLTQPADGARDVAVEEPTVVLIQFSRAMNAESLRAAISIQPPLPFRFRTEGASAGGADVAVLELPALGAARQVVRYRTRYTVTVDGSAADVDGVAMGEPYRFGFTTGGARVLGSRPEDGADGVTPSPESPITFRFNAPIDRNSVSADDISISPRPFGNPNIRVRNDSATGWSILLVEARFAPDTNYTVSLRRAPRTIAGDRIENVPYRIRFRTTGTIAGSEYFGIEDSSDNSRPNDRERERDRRRP